MKNKVLKIIKIQRPLFGSSKYNDILVYGVDPETLEKNTIPETVDWDEEQIKAIFAEEEGEFNKAYWLVCGDKKHTTFLEPVFIDAWE